MGLDIYCSWIAGAPIEKVTNNVVVTRYDTNTGKPYEATTLESVWRFKDAPHIVIDLAALSDEVRAELIHFPCNESDDELGFAGIRNEMLGSHRSGGDTFALFPSKGEQLEAVIGATSELRGEFKYEGPVQLWFVQEMSY